MRVIIIRQKLKKMLIISRLFHIFAISLFVNFVHSQGNLNKGQDNAELEMQREQAKQRLDNLQYQINNMKLDFDKGFNAKGQALIDIQVQATKKMQQLEELGKEIHAWNEILKKINQYVSKGNSALVAFNDKVATLMTKMVGFEQQIKAVVSLDTLVIFKILKDEFIDQGYQPVSESTRLSVSDMSSSVTLGEREIAQ